uniref:Uncharacterized protein n=1 Tax=Solanum lycopersicum TaxID=4081 RepID=A0A3Q7FCS3_SOLLC
MYHRLLNHSIMNKSSGSPNNNAIFDVPEVYERSIHLKAIHPCFFHQECWREMRTSSNRDK